MDIIVLAGGLSTERDVSFKTGSMVASALKENGHRVILLDVFMGYSDKEENLDGIFDRADEISVKVDDIPEVAPDLAAVKASRKDPMLFRTECNPYVPDGRYRVYGTARRKRRERKAAGSF